MSPATRKTGKLSNFDFMSKGNNRKPGTHQTLCYKYSNSKSIKPTKQYNKKYTKFASGRIETMGLSTSLTKKIS